MTSRDARFLLLLLLGLLASGTRAGGNLDEDRDSRGDAESPCEVKTVTVSTLPVLRENEFSFTGAGSGSLAGGESRLLLFVRTDLPGRISVLDDLDNTALPYFTLEMSGTGLDISQVHWKQQWLENGTLYFHVSMSSSEQQLQVTQPTVREPPRVLHEHMHLLHISVMGGLIALLLLILLFTLVLYTRQRWCRRRRAPQKSASTEATHEIHYIPSVLLGPPQSRESFRGPRPLQHSSVIGMPIRETPILDDCDCEEDEQPGHLLDGKARLEDDLSSQGTQSVDSLWKGMGEANHKHCLDNRGESSKALMQRFKESFRTNTTMEITHFQNVTHSSSTGRKRGQTHNRGCPQSPMSKVTLTLITVCTCVVAVVYGTQTSCPLTVKITLHVPEHFIADGEPQEHHLGQSLGPSS
uniref:Astrotactin-1/2 N-terminal domain-containing protein n=1 Tax=Cyprinus carpio TaxID=7962 RepID=A0A8C1ULF1_CYPCA